MNVSFDPFAPVIEVIPSASLPPPTAREINEVRDRLELYPVTVGGVAYDYDSMSQTRVARAIARWAKMIFTKSGNRIEWKDATNTIRLLTLPQLIQLREDLEDEFAARSDRLHAHARTLVAQLPAVTRAELDESQWPMN